MARGRKSKTKRESTFSKKNAGREGRFPIRVVSRKEGNKYDFIGGFTREGRSDPVTVVDANGRPVPFKSIGNLEVNKNNS